MSGWRFVLSARWFGYFLLVAVFGFACYLLGNWQFARLQEARDTINTIRENYGQSPVPLASLVTDLKHFDSSLEWRPVELTGSYLSTDQLLVRTRPLNDDVGFEVLVPLRLKNGQVFIIDRGWIPSGQTSDLPDFVPAPPIGEVTVVARLKPSEPQIPGRSAPKGQLASIELPKVAELISAPTFTAAYGQLVSETPPVSPMPQALPEPEQSEGAHLSYAIQWIAFAVLAIIGLVWAIRQEHRIRNSEDPRIIAMEKRRQARKASRGPTDSEIEDSLIEQAQDHASSINSA